MRIAILSDLDFHSQANHPLELAQVFSTHGLDVTLVAPIDDYIIGYHSQRGFKIVRTRAQRGRLNYLILLLSDLIQALRISPDLIIGVNQGGFIPAYLASRLLEQSRIIYWAMELSRLSEGDRGINTRFQQRYAHKADMVWSTGIERAHVMQDDWGLKEVPYVLPNTLVTPKAYPPGTLHKRMRNYQAGDKVVLYASFLSDLTAVPQLIESVCYWNTRLKLVLVGFGSVEFLNQMNQQIQDLGLEQKIEYLGSLTTKQDVFHLLPDADLGIVMRSFQSAHDLNTVYYTPSKLLEYAAFGLPVICSDNLSLGFVEREGWGKCVNPDNPHSIADGVNCLLSDPIRLREMGSIAKQQFYTEYSMEIQGQRLLQVLHNKGLLNS